MSQSQDNSPNTAHLALCSCRLGLNGATEQRTNGPTDQRRLAGMGFHGFLHRAAASALRWLTGQLPCRKTGALLLPPDRMVVAAERCSEYTALSIGCRARLAFLTA